MIRQGKRNVDVTMLAAFCLLLLSGLVILYSTSAYNGEVKFQDAFYYLKKQLFAAGISGGASSVRGSTAGGRGI